MRKILKGIGVLSFLGVFLLSGCGCGEAKSNSVSKVSETSEISEIPELTEDSKECMENVSAFLDSYRSQDETCGEYLYNVDSDDTTMIFSGFQSYLAESIDYEIKSAYEEEEGYTVEVIITNKDFEAVIEEMSENVDLVNSDQETILNALTDRLTDSDAPTREFEVSVVLDENKKIMMSSDLSNALFGGYNEFLYNITEDRLNEEND